MPSNSGSAAPADGGAPPPPPPPPAGSAAPSASSAPAGGQAALLAALNRGDGVTSGLKKVDKSEMTHKNPELRASSVVPETVKRAPPPLKAKPGSFVVQKKPARTELEDGNKWIIVGFTSVQSRAVLIRVYRRTTRTTRISPSIRRNSTRRFTFSDARTLSSESLARSTPYQWVCPKS